MIDYEMLRIIWWLLLGILLIGFAIMDGFDMGVCMLLPFVGKKDIEKRVVINTVGPVWEGNQVWIILGAGAIFAAWPYIYAVSFSGFYLAMLLALAGFIVRPVGFKYRSKIDHPTWRFIWDICLFLGGFIPSLVFGVAIGNVLQGAPFYFDETLRSFYTGSFFQLLNPFAILCGLVSVTLLGMHGGFYLATKTEGVIHKRAVGCARISGVLMMILFACAGLWIAKGIAGYLLAQPVSPIEPSNPLHKTVIRQVGAWMQNYRLYPFALMAPVLGFLGAILAVILANFKNSKFSFLFSAISIFGVVATVGVSMFPFILPSSINPNMSLLLWDSSSSQLTLFIMLISAVIFMPIIIGYTSWVYYVLRGKVTEAEILKDSHSVY